MKDILGQKFGRWTVIGLAETQGVAFWHVKCECGNERSVSGTSLRYGNSKSCGCRRVDVNRQRAGINSHHWKGGKRRTKSGYIEVWDGAGRYISEHRKVMSEHLGRPLFDDESVHHKNGIRHDNRLENLELKASSHGKGQSIPDLISWAEEILRRYK